MHEHPKDLPSLPHNLSYYVLPQRDMISNGNRGYHSLFCPGELGEKMQIPAEKGGLKVDYFFEIGGYTGDCAVLAGWFGFAQKGVIAVDGSLEATERLKKTFGDMEKHIHNI